MPGYRNASKADLTLGDGTTIAKGQAGEADPQSVVEKAWVADGWLVPIDPPPVAAKGKKE